MNSGCNFVQPSYNNSIDVKLLNLWDQLPLYNKLQIAEGYRKTLRLFNFSNLMPTCKCNYCLSLRILYNKDFYVRDHEFLSHVMYR